MKRLKLLHVLRFYPEELAFMGYRPDRLQLDTYLDPEDTDRRVQHAVALCKEAEVFVLEDPPRVEKAMRWLGFIQGVLWSAGIYTVEDLKAHNRPDAAVGQT